jgi:hypothetical protein
VSDETRRLLTDIRDELQMRINATRIRNTAGIGWKDGMSEAVRLLERELKRIREADR